MAGEDIGITVIVTNRNPTTATNVRFGYESPGAWVVEGADRLSSRPSVSEGQQMLFRVVLRPTSPTSTGLPFQFRATLDGIADPTPGDNGTNIMLKVHQPQGSVSGVFYEDRNGNGQVDQGEGLPNMPVFTRGGTPAGQKSFTTDGNGAFSASGFPAGRHTIWAIDYMTSMLVPEPGFAEFVVEDGKETKLRIPTSKPVSASLKVSMSFDKPSYAPGDEVGVNITLTNTGAKPLTNVIAICSSPDSIRNSPDFLPGTGPGWAALSPEGPGVTVPAGGETKVRVTDSVPQGLQFAKIYAHCAFGNDGRRTDKLYYATPSAGAASADVHGIFGDVSGKVVNARTGEPVRDTAVAVLDPITRRVLKDATTNNNGVLTVYDVPVGKVAFLVAGKWKPKDGTEFTADVVADSAITPELQVVPGDADVPEVGRHRPDIELTAKFDKDSYDIAEPLRLKVTVKNIGTGFRASVSLKDEFVENTSLMEYDKAQFGDLGDPARPLAMWPGESRELTLVGRSPESLRGDDKVSLKLRASTNDLNPANNTVLVSAAVTYLNGDAAVVLYGDRNGNKQKDAGEELANTRVFVSGGNRPSASRDVHTDASGRAAFPGLPVGVFQVYAEYHDGWVRHEHDQLTVSAGTESVLEIGAVRPLSDKFFATVSFLKDTYRPGENYELDVTLENRTGADMPVVQAHCSGPGDAGEIYNYEPGWGALASDGAGVSLKDGEKRTWRVSGTQPKDAAEIGYATISCSFAPDYTDPGAAVAEDDFRVPGQRADASGRLVKRSPTSPSGSRPVPGATLVLVDHMSQKVVARTITDETGLFQVFNLPVGRYDVVVPGPWKVAYDRSTRYFHVRAGYSEVQVLYLVPGPEVEDPGYPLPEDQTPGTNTPPAPAGGGGDGGAGEVLAKTGASVLGLGVLGALLVAFGLGASVFGRRRQPA